MDQWTNGPMVQWTNGTLEHWNIGTLKHWNTGTLEWVIGTLEHWNIWTFMFSIVLSVLGFESFFKLLNLFGTFGSIAMHDRWVQSIEGLHRDLPSTQGAQTWWSSQPRGWRTWAVEPVEDSASCYPQGLRQATPPRGRCLWRLPEPWTSSLKSHVTKNRGCFWDSHPKPWNCDPGSWQNLGLQQFCPLWSSSWQSPWLHYYGYSGQPQELRCCWQRRFCTIRCWNFLHLPLGIRSFCCWLFAPSQRVLAGRQKLQSLKIIDWIKNILQRV